MSPETGFIGRQDILEMIGRWRMGEVQRPLIITGPPGSGKTTLVNRLDEINRGAIHGLPELGTGTFTYIHYCKSSDDRTLDPIRFVEWLFLSLNRKFPQFSEGILSDTPEIQVDASQSIGSATNSNITNVSISLEIGERSHRVAYDRFIRRPLERLRLRGSTEPVFVAIDALDESLTFDRRRHLVDLLRHGLETAADPSENLRFLLTTRRGERRVKEVLSGEEIDLVVDADVRDVDEYIRREVVRRTGERDSAQIGRLVAKISEGSCGNFLFAYHAVASIERYAASGYRIPTGLTGLYSDFLQRELRPDSLDEAWLDQHWPILSTLAVARGRGLTPDQLSGTTQLAPDKIRQTLDICGQFLSNDGLDHEPVDFYHPSFREFLLENKHLRIADQRPDRRLAKFLQADYEGRPDEQASRYAIEHLQRHMARAVACERLSSERAGCRARLRAVVDDLGLLERKAALVGVDAVVADMAFALEKDEGLRPQFEALDKAAGHLRSWRPDLDPPQFAQQVLDAARQTGADSLAANIHAALVGRGTPFLDRRWDSQGDSAELVRRLIGHQFGVSALSRLPGDRLASASYDDTVRVWSHRDGSVLKVIPLNKAREYSQYVAPMTVATPRGQLAVRAGGDLLLIDPDSGRIEQQAKDVGNGPLAVLPSGPVLTAIENRIVAWNSDTLCPIQEIRHEHCDQVVALTVAPDGTVYFADKKGKIYSWDPTAPAASSQVALFPELVTALTAAGHIIAVGSASGLLHILDLQSGSSTTFSEHRAAVRALLLLARSSESAAEPELLLASASDDTTIRIWDVKSAAFMRALVGHEGMVQALADLGSGLLASAESQDVVHLWNLGITGNTSVTAPRGAVRSLAITRRGAIAGYEDGALRMWNVENGQFEAEFLGHDGPVRGLVIAGDGHLVSAGEDGMLLVRAQSTGDLEQTIDPQVGKCSHLVAAADGRVVVAAERGVRLIDIEKNEVTYAQAFPPIYGLTASSGGWIAIGEDRGRQRLFNLHNNESRFMRRGSDGFYLNSVHTLVIAGERLLISDGRSFDDPVGSIFVYDIETEEILGQLSTYPSDIYTLAVDSCFRLWSTCRDRTIRVTSLDTYHILAQLALDRIPRFLAIVDEGNSVVIGDMAGNVSRFDYVIPSP